MGRALSLHPGIKVFGYWFLSNHYHLLLWAPDAQTLSAFMTHLNGNIAKEVGALHRWRQKFWGRRYRAIVVCDARAMEERLEYLLSQGCKEGLISHPSDWPGVTSLRAMLDGTPDQGRWYDRSERHRREHAGERLDRNDSSTLYLVPLSQLPCWKNKSVAWCRTRIRSLVARIARATARTNRAKRLKPIGVATILSKSPSYRPTTFAARPAPMCHASNANRRTRFLERYFRFVDRCRRATQRLRENPRARVRFPRGAFVPRQPLAARAAVDAA